jgi:hypothetical protein
MERLLAKPLQGGLFGQDTYELATMPCVAKGLHSVRYLVIQRRAGIVVSVADDKQEALAGARRAISALVDMTAASDGAEPRQWALWTAAELPKPVEQPSPGVPRRRREIFARSRSKCFYCEAPLQLDGEWEVEHQRPRALGGDDAPLNLVVACRRCNREKSDRTALEFVTREDQ